MKRRLYAATIPQLAPRIRSKQFESRLSFPAILPAELLHEVAEFFQVQDLARISQTSRLVRNAVSMVKTPTQLIHDHDTDGEYSDMCACIRLCIHRLTDVRLFNCVILKNTLGLLTTCRLLNSVELIACTLPDVHLPALKKIRSLPSLHTLSLRGSPQLFTNVPALFRLVWNIPSRIQCDLGPCDLCSTIGERCHGCELYFCGWCRPVSLCVECRENKCVVCSRFDNCGVCYRNACTSCMNAIYCEHCNTVTCEECSLVVLCNECGERHCCYTELESGHFAIRGMNDE